MKKLMIAIAALAMGFSANAAAYYWGLQSYDYLGPDGSGYDSDMGANLWAGGTAFLYLGTVAYDNGFDTIAPAMKYCDCDGRAACPQAAAAR